jgi:hypothetical protein
MTSLLHPISAVPGAEYNPTYVLCLYIKNVNLRHSIHYIMDEKFIFTNVLQGNIDCFRSLNNLHNLQ